ncbi:helicase-related protein, partial [Listeria monocytogenes]|uniref:helicase-related protein n=1 Tax=Listeria monocytogenes TaxID=1639 RepID=UPI002FDBBF9D
ICFSSGVAHGEELVRRFAEVGLNFVQISYRDSDEYKTEVLQEFAKPDTCIHGVISSDILSRGFDQTDVEHVILARPLRKSFSMHVQM